MDYFAAGMTKLYEIMTLLPRWAMFLISGSLASVIINYFHKSSAAATPARRQATQPPATANDEKVEKKESAEPQPKASGVNLPQTTKRKKANAKGATR